MFIFSSNHLKHILAFCLRKWLEPLILWRGFAFLAIAYPIYQYDLDLLLPQDAKLTSGIMVFLGLGILNYRNLHLSLSLGGL